MESKTKRKSILHILGRSYALEILRAVNEKSMRFTDLKDVCKSNRTRSARIKELEDRGLIKAIPTKIRRRAYIFYEITPKGREVLDVCEKLLKLETTRVLS